MIASAKIDNIVEKTVSFDVEGCALSGILAMPDNAQLKGAYVFSHGWAGNRNGPANLLTQLARALASAGYATLRFDFRGRGESEGDGVKSTLSTMADDLRNAAQYLKQACNVDSISILGMCSGGNVSIGALPQMGNVTNMILLSVYPFSDGDSFGRDVNRSKHFLAVYLRKACSLENWKRVFCGDASLMRVFRVIFRPFLKRNENAQKEGGAASARLVKASANESRNSAAPPPQKFLANLRQDVPVTMIYGTADPDAAAAEKYYSEYSIKHKLPIEFIRLDGANHNFSSKLWQEQLIQTLLSASK